MGSSTRFRTRGWSHAARDRGVDDLAATEAPQLFEGDVGADGAVAEMTEFLTPVYLKINVLIICLEEGRFLNVSIFLNFFLSSVFG